MNTPAVQQRIASEAAEWLLRLEEDDGASCSTDFVQWLRVSPHHIDEFLLVEAAWRSMHHADPQRRIDLDALIDSARSDIVPLSDTPFAAPATAHRIIAPRARRRPWAYAAGIALLICGGWFASSWFTAPPAYQTAVGEQRAFKLPDGSLLHLNTHSRAEIRFSDEAREVHLLQGEALFTVKADSARPFRVLSGTAKVQAIGTAFNVYYRTDSSTVVSVVEGRVNVSTAAPGDGHDTDSRTAPLSAGEEVRVQSDGRIVKQNAADIASTLAWRQRRLVFRATPLAEVIAQFNRYNSAPRLQLSSDAIARRRITATFNADDPRALLNFLREDATVLLEVGDDTVTIDIRGGGNTM